LALPLAHIWGLRIYTVAEIFDYNDEAFVFTNVSVSLSEQVSPVPEPETYAMLLVGLGLMAFTIRRKTTA
jgi:hypothetical protein